MEELNELNELNRKISHINEVYKKTAEKYLAKAFIGLFEKYPALRTIEWTQYAPYFNDGDPCEFSARKDQYSLIVNGVNYDYDEDEDTEDGVDKLSEKEQEQVREAAAKILDVISDDILESLFGSDSIICVTKNGICSEEYGAHE